MIWGAALGLVGLTIWFAWRATPDDIARRRKPRDFNCHRDGVIMDGNSTVRFDEGGDSDDAD